MFAYEYRRRLDRGRGPPPGLSPLSARLVDLATARAAAAIHTGVLLSSFDAQLLAGPEVRRRETLYSIARRTALEFEGDADELLAVLERRFRHWR